MTMRIRYLTLANFRGVKKKTLDMNAQKVTIYGKNGTGKTTLANAVSYLLTDSPATGEKDFSPKTAGSHNLNHVAEMNLETVEGTEVTIKKDFHEVWKKKRGSQSPEFSGHETDYSLNGVNVKKKDYDATIKEIVGGDPQKALMLSQVGYFAEEMPPAERRKVLLEICGDVSDDEVMEQPGLQELKEVLKMPGDSGQRYTPEEYLQIAKAQRRDLNKQIDNIPARIDELTRTQPVEARDEATITAEIKELERQKQELLQETEDIRKEGLETAIRAARINIEKGREKFLADGNADKDALLQRISSFRQEKTLQAGIQMEVAESIRMTEREVSRLEGKRAELLKEFEELKAQRWDESQETCPTCGQSLPADTVKKLRQNFMESLANRKADINRQGKECSKQVIEAAKERLVNLKAQHDELQGKIDELGAKIAEGHKELASVPLYEETEEYKKEKARLLDLQEQLTAHMNAAASERDTSELDAKINALHEERAALKAAEATKARIEELREEQQALGGKLDIVDRNIHLCEEFFREKVKLLSKKVDDRFESVGFLLFKDQVNGGLKEVCEPLVPDSNGGMVEYKSANTAAKVNAGLEIIKVLSEYYDTYLPVIVDRAESVNNLLPMPKHQVIRLVVSAEDEDLRVVREA